jgi:hypothetical protein
VSGRIGRGWRHIRPIGSWRGVAPYGACRNLARLVARLEAVPYPWGHGDAREIPFDFPPGSARGFGKNGQALAPPEKRLRSG